MKISKKLAVLASVVLSIGLAACAGNSGTSTATSAGDSAASADGTSYKIGVIQLVQHSALDASNAGFVKALEDAGIQYEIDQQNAGGDQASAQTISQKLVDDKNDLIFAIATPAAQAAASATEEIPIVITAVTDPEKSGLVASNAEPGGNVTGSSDLTPVKEQIDLLKKLVPNAKKIGVLYSSAEANSKIQANMAVEAGKAVGLEVEEFTFSNTNEIQTVVESMMGKVDAIYTPTDNGVAVGMETITMIATSNGVPLVCGEDTLLEKGALATYGINYYELGYLAGQQAVKILTEGADPAKMPIEYLPMEKCELKINEEVAKELGIDTSAVQ